MEFLNQNVFYIMLVPLVLLFILVITSKSTVQKFFSKEMLEKLKVGDNCLTKNTRNTLFFIVLILFIIALGRPVMDKKEQNVKQALIPLVIALDVSTSMLAEDIYPNRISLAKKKLQQIIKKAKNTTIGVVLFAKDSFILSPVTEDFISLQFIVDNLNTNLDFVNGSNVFSTLEATKYMLNDYKVKNLIILSDGGNDNEYKDELDFVEENDIVIYSIGIATKDGAPIPKNGSYVTNKDGDIVTVKLNESIKKLSLQSKGGYIDYTIDDSDVDAIINRINMQSKKEELNIQKVNVYTELFYYPLALGIFLLLFALSSMPTLKRKNIVNSLLFSFVTVSFFAPTHSIAFTFNFENIENAQNAYNNKEYKKASDEYRKVNTNNETLYNLGNSLYKQGKYNDAIEIYNKIATTNKSLESKKLHNLGNSYVKTNNLEKAKELYEKSLKISEDKETKENLELVKKELEKKKNKQNKKENNQNKKKSQKKQNQEKSSQHNKEENKDKQNKNQEIDKNNKDEKKQKSDKSDTKQKNKKSENEKKIDEDNKQQEKIKSGKENNIKKEELSNREEKKWMKLLKSQNSPVYMQKVQTEKESKYDEEQPW